MATIELPYGIIAVDNTNGGYGICAAYNIEVSESKFDLLCFIHKDILLHTQNRGTIVAEILADLSIGLVGAIGSKYLVDASAHWWGCGLELCRAVPGSMALTEAMLCGRPVVATKAGKVPEVAKDNYNGYVATAATVELLDEALERVRQDRAHWSSVGKR